MKFHLKNSLQTGFSLVEMLIVIAIIGIIAAIAIPNIGSINGAATSAKNQRNAQNIVSIFTSGAAAGVTWTTTTRDAAVANVVSGGSPATGAFAGKNFSVPDMQTTDITGAYPYIGQN